MSRIRSKDTGPERIVRKSLYRLGYRYRLNDHGLPGRPDIVLTRQRCVVLVHGCFWHRHGNCPRSSTPKSNRQYWDEKIRGNVGRDHKNRHALRVLGWKVITVWECQAADVVRLQRTLTTALDRIVRLRRRA